MANTSEYKVVAYRSAYNGHHKMGLLIREGVKWAYIIGMEMPICIVKRPVGEGYEETGDDAVKAVQTFRRATETMGVTKSAADALGLKNVKSVADDSVYEDGSVAS